MEAFSQGPFRWPTQDPNQTQTEGSLVRSAGQNAHTHTHTPLWYNILGTNTDLSSGIRSTQPGETTGQAGPKLAEGIWSELLVRLRWCAHNPPLPSILHANVQ